VAPRVGVSSSLRRAGCVGPTRRFRGQGWPALPIPSPLLRSVPKGSREMDFRILGPLEVTDNGREPVIATGKQRALLARLLSTVLWRSSRFTRAARRARLRCRFR
jgi:hypothetical protein